MVDFALPMFDFRCVVLLYFFLSGVPLMVGSGFGDVGCWLPVPYIPS